MYLSGAPDSPERARTRAIFLSRASSVLSLGSINGFNIHADVLRFCSVKQEHFFQSYAAKYMEQTGGGNGGKDEIPTLRR